MNLLNKIFKKNSPKIVEPPLRIKITAKNLEQWPKFNQLFKDGKIKPDSKGRLRYLHGAPVGDLILTRVNKYGTPIYKESAEEWFQPGSPKASAFIWP